MGYKILFIIKKMTYGGAAKMMAYLANRLSSEGYEVHLLPYEENKVVPFLASGVHLVDFQYNPPNIYAIRRILQLIKVRRVIKEIHPDVVISFLTYPNLISILASVGTGIPVIVSERGDPYANRGWFTIIRDYIYRFSDGYVFQTKGAKSYFSKRVRDRAAVIPNPVVPDHIPERWTGAREEIIVNVGRLELKQKRQDILIKAFSRIADKYQDLKLVLFGDGDDKDRISQVIANYNLHNRVILAGVTKNVYESIKKAKIFVLSSDYEGIPNALIEAMHVGLPCISTNYSPGGVAELIKNNENGIIVNPGNIDELASAIEYLIENPDIAERMGKIAMNIITVLDPETIIDQWKNYINNICQRN